MQGEGRCPGEGDDRIGVAVRESTELRSCKDTNYTVEPLIKDPPRRGQPLYKGQFIMSQNYHFP